MVVLKRSKSIATDTNSQKRNLWNDILAKISSQMNKKLPQNKIILVLGDEESGKTTLFNKMRPEDIQTVKGGGLEYTYLEVREDEINDDLAKLGVWILDGDEKHENLIKFALNEESILNNNLALVTIIVDLSKPWNCVESLNKWLHCLARNISNAKLTQKQRRDLEENHKYAFFKLKHDLTPESTAPTDLEEKELSFNHGLPIVVICTKSECINDKNILSRYNMDHYDYIQMHLRTLCLENGAALIYTSSKDETNFQTLNSYLMYLTYGLKFNMEVSYLEPSKIFIPIGWDSTEKIKLLKEGLANIDLNDSINNVLPVPIISTNNDHVVEIVADDDDTFVQSLLSQMDNDTNLNIKNDPNRSRSSINMATSSPSSDGVLASFFNNLLTMNTSGSVPPSPMPNLSTNKPANNN